MSVQLFELETERLWLRQWRDSDLEPFAAMGACPEVMRYFPAQLNRAQSDAMAERIQGLIENRGWGLWALEEKATGYFIGFTGLHEAPEALQFSPVTEVGWRLASSAWGKGYATEAARCALAFGFDQLYLDEIVSFTAVSNKPSQRVMERIGLENTGENFMHPALEADSPLAEHVLYRKLNNQR